VSGNQMIAEDADIKFECSQCGQSLAIEKSGAGLTANCPICDHPVTVPPTSFRRFGGLSRRNESALSQPVSAVLANSTAPSAISQGTRSPFADPDVEEMREDLLNTTMENGQLEGELHQAKEKIDRLQAHLRKALDDCERLNANSTHAQAEIKSFHADRQQLKAELAQSRQRNAVGEAQMAENRGRIAELASDLATANAENAALLQEMEGQASEYRDYQSHMGNHVAAREEALSAATARTEEVIQALAGAEEQLLVLRKTQEELQGELNSAQAKLEEAAQIRSQLAAVEDELRKEKERSGSAETQCASLQVTCDGFKKDIDDLRRNLDDTTAGRELLALRERFTGMEQEHGRVSTALAEREASVKKLTASTDQLSFELKKVRSLCEDAERRAEEVSEGKLIKDNEVLRGIIERQNCFLNENGIELRRLRRGRFALRVSYVVFSTALLALVIFALSILKPHLLGH
jgi:predicted  nucleic acid-binding Zn-ribbon protein